ATYELAIVHQRHSNVPDPEPLLEPARVEFTLRIQREQQRPATGQIAVERRHLGLEEGTLWSEDDHHRRVRGDIYAQTVRHPQLADVVIEIAEELLKHHRPSQPP